jgi:hypothetical protein
MVVSRRSFIKRGSLLVLTAGVSLGLADPIYGRGAEGNNSPTQEPRTDNTPAPFNYAKATFSPHVDTIFRVHYPNSSKVLTTTLVSISDVGPKPDRPEAGRECFVLRFRGIETLRQNTYLVEHAVLGRFDLFLTPAGKNKQGVYYEAVINRLNA